LKLPRLPMRMGCVDISNIQGQHAVGSLVVFDSGQPDKGSYRHFKITGTSEPDDPAMMAEVVERLLSNEKVLFQSLDLLVLDGGKGQLNRIVQLFREQGREDTVPLISIAKEREEDVGEKGKGLYEKIYVPGRKNPVMLSKFPDLLHLLMRLRDEAHRFAISHYQATHRKDLLTSALDAIPGIGPRRRQALLQHFPGIDSIQQATAEELASLPGIPLPVAEAIVNALKGAT
jgi:excinuclease ABC subunit C